MIELLPPGWLAGILLRSRTGTASGSNFVVWRRMSCSEIRWRMLPLLGVAAGLLLNVGPFYAVIAVTLIPGYAAGLAGTPSATWRLDTLLGIMARMTCAVSRSGGGQSDVEIAGGSDGASCSVTCSRVTWRRFAAHCRGCNYRDRFC